MQRYDIDQLGNEKCSEEGRWVLADDALAIEQDNASLRRCFHMACEELAAMKAALVEEGEDVPIGPAISLIHDLKQRANAQAVQE